MATTYVTKEALCHKRLVIKFVIEKGRVNFHYDSQSLIYLTNN